MKAKHLFLTMAALLIAGGLWFARSAWRTHLVNKASTGVSGKMPGGRFSPGEMLQPPNPNRRFQDLTPEQRVQLARRGTIGG